MKEAELDIDTDLFQVIDDLPALVVELDVVNPTPKACALHVRAAVHELRPRVMGAGGGTEEADGGQGAREERGMECLRGRRRGARRGRVVEMRVRRRGRRGEWFHGCGGWVSSSRAGMERGCAGCAAGPCAGPGRGMSSLRISSAGARRTAAALGESDSHVVVRVSLAMPSAEIRRDEEAMDRSMLDCRRRCQA